MKNVTATTSAMRRVCTLTPDSAVRESGVVGTVNVRDLFKMLLAWWPLYPNRSTVISPGALLRAPQKRYPGVLKPGSASRRSGTAAHRHPVGARLAREVGAPLMSSDLYMH